jgi:hypothetical protein
MGVEAPEMSENNIPHVVDQGASVDERWERLAKIEKTPFVPHEGMKPLEHEQITEIWKDLWSSGNIGHIAHNFARAIEKAHGIK